MAGPARVGWSPIAPLLAAYDAMVSAVSETSELTPSAGRAAALERAWQNLVTSGPTLNSSERQQVISSARRAWAREPVAAGSVLDEAAYWIARDAGGITGENVDGFVARGLDRHRYLETVGVVARAANVDFYLRGLGAAPIELLGPDDTTPTGDIDPDATRTDGWVPATGPLFAPRALDALPAEGRALRDLHEPMYMPLAEMDDPAFVDVLTRAQIELIAARTSVLNECFY